MTKLSDTQLVILTAACSRDARLVLPLPASLKGGAASKVVQSLMAKGLVAKGLVAEIDVGQDDPVWRTGESNRRTRLRVTDAAFAALNLEPDEAAKGANGGTAPADEAPVGPTAPATPKIRAGTKQAQLIEMLRRPEGATIDAFGWQPHTARGANCRCT